MEIVRKIGGYSLGHADILRRAMGKKDMKVMERERRNFIYGEVDESGEIITPGAIRNGVDEVAASKIYDLMLDFANYAFNKSHSAAYAVVAYRTAWLKYYYPVEFMAALISSVMDDSNSVTLYIQESKRLGIEILPPDINYSKVKFTVDAGKIRFGLSAVKNVGIKFIETIVKAREDGRFRSLTDFIERLLKTDSSVLNKRAVESLIKCGALDSLGGNRAQYLSIYEKLIDGLNDDRKRNVVGQFSIFDSMEKEHIDDNLPDLKDFPKNSILNMEKEIVGIYLSGHPLEEYEEEILKISTVNSLELKSEEDLESGKYVEGKRVTIAGLISQNKVIFTKQDKQMAFLTLEDLYGEIECIVFPRIYDRFVEYLMEDEIVVVKGRLNILDGEETKIIVESIGKLDKYSGRKLYLKLDSKKNIKLFNNIQKLLNSHKGDTPVYIFFQEEDLSLVGDKSMWIRPSEELLENLINLLGNDSVKLL